MKKILLSLPIAAFLLTNCKEDKTSAVKEVVDNQISEEKTAERTENIEYIFFNVPSSMEMTQILQIAGASYDISLPNNPMKVDEYNTSDERALNLGVYGADLNYASSFSKSTETQLYLDCANTLGTSLGLEEVFDENTVDRIDRNFEFPDSMKVIINETFWAMDSYLKEDEREDISAMIVAGGWIEGLFLATQLNHYHPDNEQIKHRIAEQKYSLENLILLLESFGEDETLVEHLESLKELQGIYDNVKESKGEPSTADNSGGVQTIGAPITLDFTDETLEQIKELIEELRNDIIKKEA